MAKPIEAQYDKIPVRDLRFDPENPRLGGATKRKDQEQIQKYLEGPPHYALDLIGSIVENGFLPYEPLIVRKAGGKFVVIEVTAGWLLCSRSFRTTLKGIRRR